MKNKLPLNGCTLLLLTSIALETHALTIQFDYSYDDNGFFSDPLRRSVLEAAGGYFASVLTDDLDAIVSSGSNSFTAVFADPADISQSITLSGYSVPADTVIVFAGGQQLGSTLGIGGPGGYSASGTSAFLETVATRGETGAGTSPPSDFGPWGGSVTFDIDANWYFDTDPASDEAFSGNDFYSVALHELGHLLGIGTAGSWNALVNSGYFTGSNSTAVHGGNVPLSPDEGHWAEGTQGLLPGGIPQETAMDPSLTTGTRKRFTDLDLAALQDVGWEVTPVPVPAALPLLLSGLGALSLVTRRRGKTARP